VLTSATGFFFHSGSFGPAHVVGVILLLALTVAIITAYIPCLAGTWRWVYVVSAVVALYLNIFVSIVQAFQKVPSLQPLASRRSEPPFLIVQLMLAAILIVLGFLAARRFPPEALQGIATYPSVPQSTKV
jgi:putative exporter of polyketide antibiotics